MRYLLGALVALPILINGPARAQLVGVVLNPGGTAVLGANPTGVTGTTQICGSIGAGCPSVDPRWTAWQAQQNAILTTQQYNAAYAALIAPGFALTSSAISCAPCYFPVDSISQNNYSLQYQSIVNDAIIIASISTSGTMTVSGTVSPPALSVGQYIFGTNIPAGEKITSLGSGTGGAGTYAVSPSPSAAVASEYMFAGGLGTGWVTGSVYPVVDVSGAAHFMSPPTFLEFRNALGGLAACSIQAWEANGDAFPSSCALTGTIP